MCQPLIGVEQLVDDFQSSKSWDKQYRLLIRLGKKLPPLSDSEKTEVNQVHGCESLAWLVIEKRDNHYYFKMDSDTRVVRGLMMILAIVFQGKRKVFAGVLLIGRELSMENALQLAPVPVKKSLLDTYLATGEPGAGLNDRGTELMVLNNAQ